MFDEAAELDVVEWFQDVGAWLEGPMAFFTLLGNPLLFVVIVAVIFWSIDSGLGQRMALFTFFAGSVSWWRRRRCWRCLIRELDVRVRRS